ncbi:hypothetical protein [Chitinophaga pinensis]|uniref:Uncharacterized protein n=1 Tax=Chitinophaga pinensis (strain ATCC 43595 / DSM 2588 / LMG 13176 / NBRC 15968 / NCIMB 11800 / UQM 2034) TaxID=485918 RepID=A0A979G5X2_CHIPD|nr:hypothetical protein [Chitinophaga pinensis]ACU61315.1 hypothetical protein Cpin_3853 [Chitinophaga pinensis DSM 2588]
MNSIIGQTFTYQVRGKSVERKVIDLITRKGVAIYHLLDPVTKKHHEAIVSVFNHIFKPHARRKLGKKWGKGTKGKIGSKQQLID